MNKSKGCNGCIIISECVLPYQFKQESHVYKCPCIQCLVKMMCLIECKQYKSYVIEYQSHVWKFSSRSPIYSRNKTVS